VLAVLLALMLWLSFRALRAWRRNTYRRQALREFGAIKSRGQSAAGNIPELLKRTALSAWPRSGVASLSGAEWHDFLDRTAPEANIAEIGDMLDRVSYSSRSVREPSNDEFDRLCGAAEHWLRHHRAEEA
jgi:hypothetical protein